MAGDFAFRPRLFYRSIVHRNRPMAGDFAFRPRLFYRSIVQHAAEIDTFFEKKVLTFGSRPFNKIVVARLV